MNITILIESNGVRSQVDTDNLGSTRVPGVSRTRWYNPAYRLRPRELYSLTHVLTGRSLNVHPLTYEESERLIDELLDSPVEMDRVVDVETARRISK